MAQAPCHSMAQARAIPLDKVWHKLRAIVWHSAVPYPTNRNKRLKNGSPAQPLKQQQNLQSSRRLERQSSQEQDRTAQEQSRTAQEPFHTFQICASMEQAPVPYSGARPVPYPTTSFRTTSFLQVEHMHHFEIKNKNIAEPSCGIPCRTFPIPCHTRTIPWPH